MILRTATVTSSVIAAALLAACGSMSSMSPMKPMYSQVNLPAAVQVPAGNKVAMETVGVGEITYQCSPKKDMADSSNGFLSAPTPSSTTAAANRSANTTARQRPGKAWTARS